MKSPTPPILKFGPGGDYARRKSTGELWHLGTFMAIVIALCICAACNAWLLITGILIGLFIALLRRL